MTNYSKYDIIIIESEEKAMSIEELINYNFDIEELNVIEDALEIILDIDKNSLNDIEIIKMSYLQFLLTQIQHDRSFELKLVYILMLILLLLLFLLCILLLIF